MVRIEKIGKTTLYLGDCMKIMPTLDPVDMVMTDPPFKTISGGLTPRRDYGWRVSVVSKNDGKIFKHNDIKPEIYMPAIAACCASNADVYVMTNNITMLSLMNAAAMAELKFHNFLVWQKNNKIANRWYMKELEYVLYFWKGKARMINDRGSSQVFKAPNPRNKLHPTEKPVALMEHYILNSTNEGDTVLDPFMGSGTTGVACANLGRKFIGIELDPEYFQIAWERVHAC